MDLAAGALHPLCSGFHGSIGALLPRELPHLLPPALRARLCWHTHPSSTLCALRASSALGAQAQHWACHDGALTMLYIDTTLPRFPYHFSNTTHHGPAVKAWAEAQSPAQSGTSPHTGCGAKRSREAMAAMGRAVSCCPQLSWLLCLAGAWDNTQEVPHCKEPVSFPAYIMPAILFHTVSSTTFSQSESQHDYSANKLTFIQPRTQPTEQQFPFLNSILMALWKAPFT